MFSYFTVSRIIYIYIFCIINNYCSIIGQVSEQLSIDIGDQSLDAAVAPAIDSEVTEVTSDQHVAVIDKASKPPGTVFNKVFVKTVTFIILYCFVRRLSPQKVRRKQHVRVSQRHLLLLRQFTGITFVDLTD